jgi:hypothetical protein
MTEKRRTVWKRTVVAAAALAILLTPLSQQPLAEAFELKQISIAGAGTAGTFYIMAAGMADMFNKQLGVNSVAEVTAGSVENVRLLDSKRVELGVMQVDVMRNALAGRAQFSAPVDMVALVPLYPNVIQIVTLKDSPINTFADLKGKRVSVGSPGSGILATNQIILETLGLSLNDIQPQYLSFAETTNAFRDGSVDAAIVNTAAPAPWVVDLETSHEIKLIELSPGEIEKFTSKFGHFVSAEIPKAAYKSLDGDVATFAVWITLAGRGDLPENDVYEITKAIFDNADFLKEIHVVGSYITLENVSKIATLPFHPGAVRFYKEKGIEVSEKK